MAMAGNSASSSKWEECGAPGEHNRRFPDPGPFQGLLLLPGPPSPLWPHPPLQFRTSLGRVEASLFLPLLATFVKVFGS